jgi:hypothetical protein
MKSEKNRLRGGESGKSQEGKMIFIVEAKLLT